MKKNIIYTNSAPEPIGPYSQAVEAGGFIYTSGQIGIDPITQKLVGDNVKEQALQSFKNLDAILSSSGIDKIQIVKVTIFVVNLNNFNDVNEAFLSFFKQPVFPARSTVEVSALPMGADVEIECIAYLDK